MFANEGSRVSPDEEYASRSVGDPFAFEELVGIHGSVVYGFLIRRAGQAADDLNAEVWLAAFTARGKYDPALGSFRAWLLGIARNVLLAHYRRRNREIPSEIAERADRFVDWDGVDARLDAASRGPELRLGLQTLPREELEVLLLVAWEQLSPGEAADVLGIPSGTARSRLHRARTRLRERVDGSKQLLSIPNEKD